MQPQVFLSPPSEPDVRVSTHPAEITLNGAPLGIIRPGELVIADQHPAGAALTAITPVRLARLPAGPPAE